jgi:DNA-binding NtrC family response regulator
VLDTALVFAQDLEAHSSHLAGALQSCGLAAVSTKSNPELLSLWNRFSPECLVILGSPSVEENLALAQQIRSTDDHCALLLRLPSISTELALRALRSGISDLLESSAAPEETTETIKALVARHRGCCTVSQIPSNTDEDSSLVGSGAAITSLRKQVMKVAEAEANVLITGESGTGKELMAQMIHRRSRRRDRPFVAINCAAVPEGLLESELFGYERGAFTGAHTGHEGKLQHAAGGTLFLDEVGEMSLLAQAKILRAIDTRIIQRLGSNVDTRVQVRLVAATNQDLERLVQEKRFRQDLFYRLNVVRLSMPPLRERPEDIPELVVHILRDLGGQQQDARNIEGELVRSLQHYDWPGNVRELRNVLESVLVFCSSRSIGPEDIPAEFRQKLRSSLPPYADERGKIVSALDSTHWNRNAAAKILACSRMTLYRKMGRYGIAAKDSDARRAS